jgi:hypothetical protein
VAKAKAGYMRITLDAPEELVAQIELRSVAEDRTRVQWIRDAIREKLARDGGEAMAIRADGGGAAPSHPAQQWVAPSHTAQQCPHMYLGYACVIPRGHDGLHRTKEGAEWVGVAPVMVEVQTEVGPSRRRYGDPTAPSAAHNIREARLKGYLGDPCPSCGSFTLLRCHDGTDDVRCDTCEWDDFSDGGGVDARRNKPIPPCICGHARNTHSWEHPSNKQLGCTNGGCGCRKYEAAVSVP